MALVAQFDKIVILSKRLSSMTDDKTGKTREFRFVTGFDAVSGSVFSDLSLSDDSPIQFNEIWDNRSTKEFCNREEEEELKAKS